MGKKMFDQDTSMESRNRIGVESNNYYSYLLFCDVNRFVQYYPHGALPTARMRCRPLVRHKCIRIWY